MRTDEAVQQEVFDFLRSAAANGGLPVKQINTHGASVFLAGSRVLKVKRAVKFPFLDYSTLAFRKKACLAEIEVNRTFAPELYVGLARITRAADGSLRIGGDGEVVEWAVEMVRFDETLTLDRFVLENDITAEMVDIIVRRLAEVHSTATKQSAEDWLSALDRFIREHNEVFSKHHELIDLKESEDLRRRSQQLLQEGESIILKRAEQGFLVRGHGDLHLGNIALIKGKPVIFDAVEFDPIIASGDVLYDLAFLLMDLIAHGQATAANAALNLYLEYSGKPENYSALGLLPLFLSIRSSIRAVVALAKFEHSRKLEDAEAAKHHFALAVRFTNPGEARLIAIGGLSGTGKSYLARRLAPYLSPSPGAVVIRSDVKRKNLFGVSSRTKLPPTAYTKQFTEKVYEAIHSDASAALAAGHSVILDAVFAMEEERAAAEAVAKRLGKPFHGLYLEADLATRIDRIEKRTGDASDADRSVAIKQEAYVSNNTAWISVDSSSDADTTLKAAHEAIGYSD